MAVLHSLLSPYSLKKLILLPYPKPRKLHHFQAMSSSSRPEPAALVHKVQAILLDPSCSGSGTASARLDHLLPSAPGHTADFTETERLNKLAAFQQKALAHALSFPEVERIVYSTCSVNQIENEDVVNSVLPLAESYDFELETLFPKWQRRGLLVFKGAERLLRTDPVEDKEGFFIALFVRKRSDQSEEPDLTNEDNTRKHRHAKWDVLYCSVPTSPGGGYRSTLGRLIFKTKEMIQVIEAPDIVKNKVSFSAFGFLDGEVSLTGKLKVLNDKWVQVIFEPPELKVGPLGFRYSGESEVKLQITYIDENIRLGKGSRGSLFVFRRQGKSN